MRKLVEIDLKEKKYWDKDSTAGMYKRQANHKVVEVYAKQRFDFIQKRIDINSIKNCLDVGCGTGFSSYHFPNPEILTGIDFSFRNLQQNKISSKIQASAFALPFKTNSFDLVYGWEFLHHLDEPEKVVENMARITKKYLILFEPNRYNPAIFCFALYNKMERRCFQYSKRKLLKFVKQIGFKLISCETLGWIFAGATPEFLLEFTKKIPYVNPFANGCILICEKRN